MAIGPFYTGDNPATVYEADLPLKTVDEYATYTQVGIRLIDPEGLPFTENIKAHDPASDTVELDPLGPLDAPGIWAIHVRLIDAANENTVALPPIEFVVQDPLAGWHTVSSARNEWKTSLDDVALYNYLFIAQMQCEAFAPKLTAGQRPPINYKLAQLFQARDNANAARAGANGSDGDEGFGVTRQSMSWKVQSLLRPIQAVPSIG